VTEGCGDDRPLAVQHKRLEECQFDSGCVSDSDRSEEWDGQDLLQPLSLASQWSISGYLVKVLDRSISQGPSSPLLAPEKSSVGYLWQGNGERAVYVPVHSAGEV
jgi:hypothetical protein